MTPPASPSDGRWPAPGDGGGRPTRDDDGWGPSTAVYSSGAAQAAAAAAPPGVSRGFHSGAPETEQREGDRASTDPRSARERRTARAAQRRAERSALAEQDTAPERGLPWWGALSVLLGIAAIGGLIDTIGSIQVKSGFNIGIVVASVVAIIAVKRSHMFPIVVAPPIVYSGAAISQLYIRSSGLNDRRVVLDAAANYLVYGFPAIAAATAAVLIIAGVRLISRK